LQVERLAPRHERDRGPAEREDRSRGERRDRGGHRAVAPTPVDPFFLKPYEEPVAVNVPAPANSEPSARPDQKPAKVAALLGGGRR
ncbi:MAG: ATP-dependent helicase, partial [Pseudomonadota bacterium]